MIKLSSKLKFDFRIVSNTKRIVDSEFEEIAYFVFENWLLTDPNSEMKNSLLNIH